MKAYYLMALLFCSSAYADLPPVIDNSEYPASDAQNNAAPVPAPAPNPAAPNSALVEMVSRLERLQAEVQQLTGKVEEQAYQIAELKKRQSSLYSDFDERLQSVENKQNGTVAPAAEGSVEPAAEAPKADAAAAAPEPAAEAAPAAPQAADKPAAAEQPAAADKPAAVEKPQVKAEAVPVTEDQKQAYEKAYFSFRNGRTAQSITEFKAFLEQYPNSEFAGKTQYWLGEAHSINGDHEAAQAAYNAVIDKYPSSEKVPDALVGLATIAAEKKDQAKASELLNRVITQYPKTKAAKAAAKKLQQLGGGKN